MKISTSLVMSLAFSCSTVGSAYSKCEWKFMPSGESARVVQKTASCANQEELIIKCNISNDGKIVYKVNNDSTVLEPSVEGSLGLAPVGHTFKGTIDPRTMKLIGGDLCSGEQVNANTLAEYNECVCD